MNSPLQNRVTPFGEIVALSGRGLLTGNRGILVDDRRRIVRFTQVRRWIACRTEYKGIRRALMQPHAWTELFFLDEATAFGAGHRPCAECRREDYLRFKHLWERVHGGLANAESIDRVLDAERRKGRTKLTFREWLERLPDGTYVVVEGNAWLVLGSRLHRWTDRGYLQARERPAHLEVDVLTPRSVVSVFSLGYRPGIHPSALQ